MKKMKTVISVLMIFILALAFTACSKDNSGSSDTLTKTYSNSADSDFEDITVSEEETEAETEKETDSGSQNGSAASLPKFDESFTIEKTELTQTNGVIITATALTYSNYSADLAVTLENTTDSPRHILAGANAYGCNSVNGYMMHDGYLSCDLEAGESAEEEISFSLDELYLHGIDCIADMGVGFYVEDDDSNHEYSGMTSVKTKKADDYNYNEDTFIKAMKDDAIKSAYSMTVDSISESVLYDQDGIKLLAEVALTNKDGEKSLMLEFKNNSDIDKYVKIRGLIVNGQEVDDGLVESDLISSGKKAVINADISNYTEDFPQLANQKIESVEFRVNLSDFDSWDDTEEVPVKVEF